MLADAVNDVNACHILGISATSSSAASLKIAEVKCSLLFIKVQQSHVYVVYHLFCQIRHRLPSFLGIIVYDETIKQIVYW